MIYGAENLIPVGGKAEDDGLEEIGATDNSRLAGSMEPVFYHSLPPTFYEDIINAFGLTAIIDCTPGDGALALSAYKANVVYTGLTFNEDHSLHLQQHLESTIWRKMTTDTDVIFDPRLLNVLQGKGTATEPPQLKGKKKAKAKATRKRKRDEAVISDEEAAEAGEAAEAAEADAGDDDNLSGDT